MVTEDNNNSTPEIANPLRSFRKQRGLTQERAAVLAGVARGWVGFLERNPEAMTETAAQRLAPVLGVEPAALLPPNRQLLAALAVAMPKAKK